MPLYRVALVVRIQADDEQEAMAEVSEAQVYDRSGVAFEVTSCVEVK